jgi:crotonobetainyl-CoA:carnitine CoA-transferase CaiB-like acyl-CoA transferase
MGPLSGLRALEIGDRGEVPGKLLADAGADVIRVEPPGGAATRHLGPFLHDREDLSGSLRYAYFNTSKRGITLAISEPDGQAVWRRLVATSDIVIDSLGPGALDGPGAGYAAFADQEALIWCAITPFGLTGPWRDWAVNDLVSLALGGPVASCGYDDHSLPPVRPDGEHSLWISGEYAAIAILTALYHRSQTGRGQLIDVSMHEAISGTTEGAFGNYEYFGRVVQRQTGRHAEINPSSPWQYRCQDGRYINLMGGGIPRTVQAWRALVAWLEEHGAAEDLGDPKYEPLVYTDARNLSPERAHVVEVLGRFAETITSEAAYRGGQRLHIGWGAIRRPEENLEDPHWADREFFIETELAGYDLPVRLPGAPYKFARTPATSTRRAPLLGEHNYEVYGDELGLTIPDLIDLARRGVI